MNPQERQALIEQMRKQALTEQNLLYQRVGSHMYETGYDGSHSSNGIRHLFLLLFSVLVLFFAVDYFDSSHDYIEAVSDAVSSNPTLVKTYERIENSDFINWLVNLFE